MDCGLPDCCIHGISQARILEWVAISFSRGTSRPRDWTQASCIAGSLLHCRQILYRLSHQGSPKISISQSQIKLPFFFVDIINTKCIKPMSASFWGVPLNLDYVTLTHPRSSANDGLSPTVKSQDLPQMLCQLPESQALRFKLPTQLPAPIAQ